MAAETYADAEVREFVEGLPIQATYSEMAAACLERFGPERAWSRTKIICYWQSHHPVGERSRSRIDLDPEVRDFVVDRLGRITILGLVAQCRERFGNRAPSKSGLDRFWQRWRRSVGKDE